MTVKKRFYCNFYCCDATHVLDSKTQFIDSKTHVLDAKTHVLDSKTHVLDSETHVLDSKFESCKAVTIQWLFAMNREKGNVFFF